MFMLKKLCITFDKNSHYLTSQVQPRAKTANYLSRQPSHHGTY